MYWKYIDRITSHLFPAEAGGGIVQSPTGENVINRNTFMLNTDTTHYEDESTWKEVPGLPSFKKIYLPPSAVAGIQRLMEMPESKKQHAAILNMTELTPLNYEMKINEERGEDIPLWYHLGVAMFNKEAGAYCKKFRRKSMIWYCLSMCLR